MSYSSDESDRRDEYAREAARDARDHGSDISDDRMISEYREAARHVQSGGTAGEN